MPLHGDLHSFEIFLILDTTFSAVGLHGIFDSSCVSLWCVLSTCHNHDLISVGLHILVDWIMDTMAVIIQSELYIVCDQRLRLSVIISSALRSTSRKLKFFFYLTFRWSPKSVTDLLAALNIQRTACSIHLKHSSDWSELCVYRFHFISSTS